MSLAEEKGISVPKTVVALLEAMAPGVPAVVTRVAGVSEVLENGTWLLVPARG